MYRRDFGRTVPGLTAVPVKLQTDPNRHTRHPEL